MHAKVWLGVFAVLAVLLALLGLATGTSHIALSGVIEALFRGEHAQGSVVRQVRLPQVLTAVLAGSGLATGGLLMQAVFRNPLAGPGVLGINGGASLGVALVVLAQPLWAGLPIPAGWMVTLAALAGAVLVLGAIMLADRRVGDAATLLIIGLMFGYLCSALVSLLQAGSEALALQGFVRWGLGSFAGTALHDLPWLALPVVAAVLLALPLAKPLNALMLGEEEAMALGVNVGLVRRTAIVATALLAGSITAWCGPIAFLGLAVPHVARALLRTADLRLLLPGSVLLGAVCALGCDLLIRGTRLFHAAPLNVVTSLLGVPVVLWVLIHGRHWTGRP